MTNNCGGHLDLDISMLDTVQRQTIEENSWMFIQTGTLKSESNINLNNWKNLGNHKVLQGKPWGTIYERGVVAGYHRVHPEAHVLWTQL